MRRIMVAVMMAVSVLAVSAGRSGAADAPGFTITPGDQILGAPKAPVTLIEYASPSCPHCAYFFMNAFPQVKKKYIDTGKVRFVFRVFPLRAEDGDAEKLARCAPGGGYFRFMEMLFRNQAKWDPEFGVTDSRAQLVALAASSGLSTDQANSCVNDTAQDGRINAVAQEAETRYHVNGTPTFVIDGTAQPSGFRALEELTGALDTALAKKS